MDHVIQLVNATNTAMTWKDFIPLGSALIAGGLTVCLVRLNNNKMLNGQIRIQKELFDHQTKQLQQQLDHDLTKHKAQMDLDRKNLYFNIKSTNSHLISQIELDRIIRIENLVSKFIIDSHHMQTFFLSFIPEALSNKNMINIESNKEKITEHNSNVSNLLLDLSYQFSITNKKELILINLISNVVNTWRSFLDHFFNDEESSQLPTSTTPHEISKSRKYNDYITARKKLLESLKDFIDNSKTIQINKIYDTEKEITNWMNDC